MHVHHSPINRPYMTQASHQPATPQPASHSSCSQNHRTVTFDHRRPSRHKHEKRSPPPNALPPSNPQPPYPNPLVRRQHHRRAQLDTTGRPTNPRLSTKPAHTTTPDDLHSAQRLSHTPDTSLAPPPSPYQWRHD